MDRPENDCVTLLKHPSGSQVRQIAVERMQARAHGLPPLPPPAVDGARHRTSLLCPTQVYIIGTAHVSRKAAEDVAALISRVSPVIVVLELDEQRQQKLIEQARAAA
jgi:hypothetical protein